MKKFHFYFLILLGISIFMISCQRRENPFPEQKDILFVKETKTINFQKLAQQEAALSGEASKEIFIEEPGDIKGSYKKLTGNTWIFQFDENGRILAKEKRN